MAVGFSLEDLKVLAQQANEAEKNGVISTGGAKFKTLADGTYYGTIIEAQVELSKAKKQMIVYSVELNDGEDEGYVQKVFNMLEVANPESIAPMITLKSLERHLRDADKIEPDATIDQYFEQGVEIHELLSHLVGVEVSLTVKSKAGQDHPQINMYVA